MTLHRKRGLNVILNKRLKRSVQNKNKWVLNSLKPVSNSFKPVSNILKRLLLNRVSNGENEFMAFETLDLHAYNYWIRGPHGFLFYEFIQCVCRMRVMQCNKLNFISTGIWDSKYMLISPWYQTGTRNCFDESKCLFYLVLFYFTQ